jgi:hypothetical protein
VKAKQFRHLVDYFILRIRNDKEKLFRVTVKQSLSQQQIFLIIVIKEILLSPMEPVVTPSKLVISDQLLQGLEQVLMDLIFNGEIIMVSQIQVV